VQGHSLCDWTDKLNLGGPFYRIAAHHAGTALASLRAMAEAKTRHKFGNEKSSWHQTMKNAI
jgi:hypothetical protein